MEALAVSHGEESTRSDEETGKQPERTPLDDHKRNQAKG
jgi:hypothetical protein